MRDAAAIVAYLCFFLAFLCVLQQLGLALVGILMRSRLPKIEEQRARSRFLVLIPAHNEGIGVLPTISSLRAMKYPADLFSIVVVADNCTDDTAMLAQQAGATVLVHNDALIRGKGNALAWAFAQPDLTHFDAVVVIDADTKAEANLLGRFNDALLSPAHLRQPAVYQVRYEFSGDECSQPWLQLLSVAAKAAENSFVYRPREILGLTNLLQGNGFCVPLSILAMVPWKANSIVEDAEYAIDLCLAGVRCRYIDDVRVISRLVKNERDSAPQKVRWSKGLMLLIRSRVPKLISEAIRLRRSSFAEAASMLLLTSRMSTLYLLLAGVLPALFALGHNRLYLLLILVGTLLGQTIYAMLVVCASSDEERSLMNALLLPRYVVHIAMAHVRSLASLKSREWTRTVR